MEKILVWGWKNAKSLRNTTLWFGLTILFLGIAGYVVWDESNVLKKTMLPGPSTDGHYQFEQACNQCHSPFNGVETKSCLNCHQEELKIANDSHRPKVFRDPRNAADLEKINAMECGTCHSEHDLAKVTEVGVTLPKDFCIYCHEDVAKDRPSHKDLKFNGCRQCHNYHDNRALHEDHIEKHIDEADTFDTALAPLRKPPTNSATPLKTKDLDWANKTSQQITQDWATTSHAEYGINCSNCHLDPQTNIYSETTTIDSCKRCHNKQATGFLAGKHGIRNHIPELDPMSPKEARAPMHEEVQHKQLGCTSCHNDHLFDTRTAAVEPCMKCHADEHTQTYKQSPHYQLYLKEISGERPAGSGVSCATCHMPRTQFKQAGEQHVYVQHNQNDNLRPNQKMVREVCQHCHGLKFTLNALADPKLIDNNFQGKPEVELKTVDMVKNREKK